MEDRDLLQLLVNYLRSVEYWSNPDYGAWEECKIRHLSSIGSVVAGLSYLKRMRLAIVPDTLIDAGWKVYREIFPRETMVRAGLDHCRGGRVHSHDCDASQLTLIWPHHLINERDKQDLVLSRLIDRHTSESGEYHRLLQQHGFNRYWGDDYYTSRSGVSAEWPIFKFWLSIIYSQRNELGKAKKWFSEVHKKIVENKIPEAYQNGKPNEHTPLAWAHAIALIAYAKLPQK